MFFHIVTSTFYLPWQRMLKLQGWNIISILPKVQRASFWEVIDSFVLLAYASLAASRTLLQQLLACLNFTSELYLSF